MNLLPFFYMVIDKLVLEVGTWTWWNFSFYKLKCKLMMLFSTGTGLERMGSSGRTETADELDWWMPDRLGWDKIAAMSTRGLRCGAPLQTQSRWGVGEGFARGRSDA